MFECECFKLGNVAIYEKNFFCINGYYCNYRCYSDADLFSGARVLIFSQFVIVLNILEKYTKLRGHKYLRFDGTTQVSER